MQDLISIYNKINNELSGRTRFWREREQDRGGRDTRQKQISVNNEDTTAWKPKRVSLSLLFRVEAEAGKEGYWLRGGTDRKEVEAVNYSSHPEDNDFPLFVERRKQPTLGEIPWQDAFSDM